MVAREVGDRDLGTSRKLASLPQMRGLEPDTLAELASITRIRKFTRGDVVVEAGAETNFIGFVVQGILRMQKRLLDGRIQIVGLLMRGDVFGRMFNGPYYLSIEAATDVEFCAFHRPSFESLILRAPDLERVILLNLLDEIDRARDWMSALSHSRIRGRVASFLLMLCSRFNFTDGVTPDLNVRMEVHIPISRTDLADLLGTRRESLSRAFHALADDGVIGLKSPSRIEVLDIEALSAEAGEEHPSSFAVPATLRQNPRSTYDDGA